MGSVNYTATESLLPFRSNGARVSFDVDLQEARRSRRVEKSEQRSVGGAMEVLKHRADVTYDLAFEPVHGFTLLQLREFLDSTEGGELFSIDLYGTASKPMNVRRIDSGYSEDPFMRRGSEDSDVFTVSISVLVIS